jgi:hypothetical protein
LQFEAFVGETRERLSQEARGHVRATETELARSYSELFGLEKARLTAAVEWEANTRIRTVENEAAAAAGALSERVAADAAAAKAAILAADTMLSEREAAERVARRAARVSAAVLALSAALDARRPVEHEVAALRVASEDEDAVLATALLMLPPAAFARGGVASHAELAARWGAASAAGRRAALVPAGAGVVGQAVGAAQAVVVQSATGVAEAATTAWVAVTGVVKDIGSAVIDLGSQAAALLARAGIHLPSSAAAPAPPAAVPAASAKGLDIEVPEALRGVAARVSDARDKVVAGASEARAAVASVNATFDAAHACVEADDLPGAIARLKPLTGYAASAVGEWVEDAKARDAADGAVRLARARAALLAVSLL